MSRIKSSRTVRVTAGIAFASLSAALDVMSFPVKDIPSVATAITSLFNLAQEHISKTKVEIVEISGVPGVIAYQARTVRDEIVGSMRVQCHAPAAVTLLGSHAADRTLPSWREFCRPGGVPDEVKAKTYFLATLSD